MNYSGLKTGRRLGWERARCNLQSATERRVAVQSSESCWSRSVAELNEVLTGSAAAPRAKEQEVRSSCSTIEETNGRSILGGAQALIQGRLGRIHFHCDNMIMVVVAVAVLH